MKEFYAYIIQNCKQTNNKTNINNNKFKVTFLHLVSELKSINHNILV